MKPFNIFMLLVFSFFIHPLAVSADIYHWRDEKGVDHYTNKSPPPEAEVLLEEPDTPNRSNESGVQRDSEEMERTYLEKEAIEAELDKRNILLQETVESAERSIEELHEKLAESDRKADLAQLRIEDLQRESFSGEDPEPRVEVYVEREYIPFFVDKRDKRFGKDRLDKRRGGKKFKPGRDGKSFDRKRRFDDHSPSSLQNLQEKSRLRHASGIPTGRRLF